MNFRVCAKCGGKKLAIKTEHKDKITIRTRKCKYCNDISHSYEQEMKPIFGKRETELIEEYRAMATDFKKILRSFIRVLREAQEELDIAEKKLTKTDTRKLY